MEKYRKEESLQEKDGERERGERKKKRKVARKV
jgi:hypothetical protein